MKAALTALSTSMLLSSLGTSIANVGLPTIAQSFGASFHAVQWVVVAYLLVITAFVLVVGRLGDLVGRRRLLVAGIAVFTVASLLCGLAPTLPLLVAARALQGLGAAVMMALTIAFVSETVSPDRTGSAMGLLGTMSAIGTAAGPSLGGALIALFGWRALFLAIAPLGALTFALAYRHLPAAESERAPARGGVDAGMLRLASSLSATLIMSVLVSNVMMATLVVGPFYLERTLGLAPAIVGVVLSIGPIVTALSGLPAGRFADRVGANRATIVGLAAMIAGTTLLALSLPSLGIAGYVVPIAVTTAGYALFQVANNTAAMAGIAPDRRGAAAGMLGLSRNLGLVSGASAMGAVFALASGAPNAATAAPGAAALGMHVTFALAAMLILIALAVGVGSGAARSAHSGPSERAHARRSGGDAAHGHDARARAHRRRLVPNERERTRLRASGRTRGGHSTDAGGPHRQTCVRPSGVQRPRRHERSRQPRRRASPLR